MARFSHGKRFDTAVSLAVSRLPQNGKLMDYGAGGTTFLRKVAPVRPDVELFGYDPYAPIDSDTVDITVVADATTLPRSSFDVITAFEVLEHLADPDVDAFVEFATSHVTDRGFVIVSVPIMDGPILVPKYLNARFVKKSVWRYSNRELVGAAFLGREVPRQWHNNMYTHKGFSWRKLRDRLTRDFTLVDEQLSPFAKLRYAGLNSQWMAVLQTQAG